MTGNSEVIYLSYNLWEMMRAEAERLNPEEACGILAGKNNVVYELIPVENALHSRVRFRMDPQGQLNALVHLEQKDWELTGIYHSHPYGPDTPSQTDIDEAYYPEALHFIWFNIAGKWQCRCFRIQDRKFTEVNIILFDEEQS